jgi:hypothetical protein
MKKTLLTLGAVALLTTPSLVAAEDSLQQHLRMEQKLQKEYQKRIKSGNGEKNQYKYNYQKQYEYKGSNPNRSNSGSMGGQRGGGGRH